jgi:hypothetical protein
MSSFGISCIGNRLHLGRAAGGLETSQAPSAHRPSGRTSEEFFQWYLRLKS